MAADGGGGDADFTLRLKQDVAGPAAIAKKAIKDLAGGFEGLGDAADKAWKKQVAASRAAMGKDRSSALRALASERKAKQSAITAEDRAMKQQLALAKQLAKEKQRAETIAGKQAARNANLADKAKQHQQQQSLRAHDIKHARGGGFDASETMGGLALGAEAAVVAGAAAAAVAVGYLGYEFLKAAEEASEFQQSSIKAIGYLTDNAPAAEGVFDDVRKEAQQLGLGVEDTVGSFQKLLAAQFSVGQSKQLIKMGADMQAIGADAEHVQRILFAMSEIKSMGTLQKRQERMLQMAGISGKLIDEALMKRMGIKTKGGLDMARKKNKIGADVAVEAIKDAVMHKTHESALGQRGAQNATTTIKGMRAQLGSGIENFFIDTGKAIEPVLTGIALHAKDLVLKIANDPQLVRLGEFLLLKWEQFGVWVDAKWPQIETMVIGGLHAIVAAVEFGFDAWQTGMDYWDDSKLALEGLAVGMGVVAVAGLLLTAPLWLAVGAIGALTVGVAMLVGYIAESATTVYATAHNLGVNLWQGFADGITGGIGLVQGAADMLGSAAGVALAKSIKSHSPSELTYDRGGDFGEGFALGIDDSHPMVKGSAVSLGGGALDSLAGGAAAAQGGGGGKGDVHIHVSCQPGATEEDGQRFGEGLMAKLDARIYSFFDGLDIEGAPATTG